MTNLEESVAAVCRAAKHLRRGDVSTRLRRRNARRKFIGALRRALNALNAEYPPIAKPKPPPAVKPPRPRRIVLPFSRAWDIKAARLFVRVAAAVTGKNVPALLAHEGASRLTTYAGVIYFAPKWHAREKWYMCIAHFGGFDGYYRHKVTTDHGKIIDIIDLWRRFWLEQIAVPDIQLAAEHLAFLQKRGVLK